MTFWNWNRRKSEVLSLGIAETRDAFDSPAVPLNSPTIWSSLFGGEPTAAGERVTEMSALQITTVYACVRIIAESVASLPLNVYERKTPDNADLAADSDLHHLLTCEPNPEMSAFTFFETLTGSLALTGNCYAHIVRDGAKPYQLWPLHPLKTSAKRLPSGELVYEVRHNGTIQTIKPEDILHVPLFSFDGLKGLSPIELARQSIGLASAAEKFGARFFGNGSRPAGLLITKANLKPDQLQQVKEGWQAAHGGANSGRTGFLTGDWSYQQIGLSPEDSQFLATRQFQRTDICALFRVPPHLAGDTSKMSNSNAEQQSLSFVTDTLRPYLCRLEQEICRKLMPTSGRNGEKFYVQFDLRQRLRGDFQSQMTGFSLAKQWGYMTTNQIRKELGESPIGPVGDVLWYPTNMGNAEALLHPSALVPVSGDPTKAKTEEPAKEGKPKPAEPEEDSEDVPPEARYVLFFRDAFGRMLKRSKHDAETIGDLFGAIFRSILIDYEQSAARRFGLQGDWLEARDRIISNVASAAAKRSSAWKPDDAPQELRRIAKAIKMDVYRAAAESVAQLQEA